MISASPVWWQPTRYAYCASFSSRIWRRSIVRSGGRRVGEAKAGENSAAVRPLREGVAGPRLARRTGSGVRPQGPNWNRRGSMAADFVTRWLLERKPDARVTYLGVNEDDIHVWDMEFPEVENTFRLGIESTILDDEG